MFIKYLLFAWNIPIAFYLVSLPPIFSPLSYSLRCQQVSYQSLDVIKSCIYYVFFHYVASLLNVIATCLLGWLLLNLEKVLPTLFKGWGGILHHFLFISTYMINTLRRWCTVPRGSFVKVIIVTVFWVFTTYQALF